MISNIVNRELSKLRESALARNAGWMLAGQGASLLLQTVYFLLLARLLGTSEYGIYVGAFALAGLVSQYSALGSGIIFMRYVGIDRKQFDIYWGNILLTSIGLGSVLVIVLQLTGRYLVSPPSAHLILFAGLNVAVCNQVASCAAQVFQTFEKMSYTAALNLLTNLMRTLLAASLYFSWRHITAWQWAAASLFVSVIAAAVAIITVWRTFGAPKITFRIFFRRAAEGFGASSSSSTASACNDIDKTMLSHYGMNEANGIYSIAYRILDIASMPASSIKDAAIPRFFREGHSGMTQAVHFARMLTIRSIAIATLCALGLMVAAPLIPLLIGHGYDQSVAALRWLAPILVFRTIHQMTGSALLGAGYQRYRTVGQLCAAGLNVGLNVIMIPRFGWLGAAWTSLLTDGSLCVMNWCSVVFLRSRERKNQAKEKECISETSLR